MKKEASAGTYQLENGLWAYRFKVLIDGKEVAKRKYTDENGNKLKTQAQAIKARERAIAKARIESKQKKPTLAGKNKLLFGMNRSNHIMLFLEKGSL